MLMYWEKRTHCEHYTIVLFQRKSRTCNGGQGGGEGQSRKTLSEAIYIPYKLNKIYLPNKAKSYTSLNEMMCVA